MMPSGVRPAAAALLLVFASLATWGAWVKSETYDEPMYILSAYTYLATGDLSLNREHPPLAKWLMGLPLLALDLELPSEPQRRAGLSFAFLSRQPRADHHLMLFLARLPGILLGVVLGLYVFRWACCAFGHRAGLLALALYAFNPNMLAHCRVAANDFAVTVFSFAALYHVWRWLDGGRRGSLALGAVTLGLALGSKLTALMLLPVIGLVVLGTALARRRPALVGHALLALLASLGVLYLLYLGEARTLGDARQHARFLLPGEVDKVLALPGAESTLEAIFGDDVPIPLLTFVKGVDKQFGHTTEGHPTYFWGEAGTEGHGGFYLATMLIKNPEALTLLLLLGLVSMRRTGRGGVHEACLWGFVVLQMVVFSTSDVQLGFKYVLPIVPFLCVAAARVAGPGAVSTGEARLGALAVLAMGAAGYLVFESKGEPRWTHALPLVIPLIYSAVVWVRSGRGGPVALGGPLLLLAGWAAVGVLARQPHDLMYFNEWAGGPEHGWYYSVIGDDWGQDTSGLARWMESHDVDFVWYDYYGTGDPAAWGVRSRPTFSDPQAFVPVEGLVAVHVSLLARLPEHYRWLAGAEPIDNVGHGILIYDVGGQQRVDAWFDQATQPRPEADPAGADVPLR